MGDVGEVNDQNFETEVLQSDRPAIVDFWAEWCAPCRQIAPIMKELASEYDGRLKIAKLDVDANPNTAAKFNVRSIPTVLAISGGQVVGQIVGFRPKSAFDEMAQKLLG